MRANAKYALIFILTGCLNAYAAEPAVGNEPSEDPPKVNEVVKESQNGRKLYIWDRPSAFGKVPADKKIFGDFICAKGRIDLEATGFHPKAQDKDGKEIPGGGYYCEPKSTGDRPQQIAPKLKRLNGIAGWDRPGAFGKVPDKLKAKGRMVCQSMGKNLDAIGYHPQARDEQDTPINGGGFLCAPEVHK